MAGWFQAFGDFARGAAPSLDRYQALRQLDEQSQIKLKQQAFENQLKTQQADLQGQVGQRQLANLDSALLNDDISRFQQTHVPGQAMQQPEIEQAGKLGLGGMLGAQPTYQPTDPAINWNRTEQFGTPMAQGPDQQVYLGNAQQQQQTQQQQLMQQALMGLDINDPNSVGKVSALYPGFDTSAFLRPNAGPQLTGNEGVAYQQYQQQHPGVPFEVFHNTKWDPPKPTQQTAPPFIPTIPVAGGAKNEEFLAKLPPAEQPLIKALVEGRMAFPTGTALRAPYWQGIIQKVAEYDPSFDTINYNARLNTRKDFTSGTSAKQVNALNTVIGHMESLDKASKALNNDSLTGWNALANWVADVTGQSAPKTFEATREAVADELTRVWRQAGGSVDDIKERKKQLSTNSSPEQFADVIGQLGDLIESKLDSMQNQYDQGMGISDVKMMTPQARATLDRLRGKTATATTAAPGKKGKMEMVNGVLTYVVR